MTATAKHEEGRYLGMMTETTDPLAETLWAYFAAAQRGDKATERSWESVVACLLHESSRFDEDVVMEALSRFCDGRLASLLEQHGHRPAVCAKIVRSNFHRLLRWRQRDEWRREARRREAEAEFTVERVREAYEVGAGLEASAVWREVAAMDARMAGILQGVQAEVRSCDELYSALVPFMDCSKATIRRRLLGLGRILRKLLRRDADRFVTERPGLCLPSAKGVCAARVVNHVMAAA